MTRVKRGVTSHRRHKKILGLTKGHHGQRHRLIEARVAVLVVAAPGLAGTITCSSIQEIVPPSRIT